MAKCIDIIKPSISQAKNIEKEMSEEIEIIISNCGSFPAYIMI